MSAGHTIYLEELGLKPGDFVSYYAKATDNDAVAGREDDDERHLLRADPAVQEGLQAGAVAGAAAAAAAAAGSRSASCRSSSARSSRRPSTSSATRRRPKPDKFRENVVFLNLAQAKLREQVEELVGKLKARLGAVDPAFKKIAEALPKAADGDEGGRRRPARR